MSILAILVSEIVASPFNIFSSVGVTNNCVPAKVIFVVVIPVVVILPVVIKLLSSNDICGLVPDDVIFIKSP